MAHWTMDGGKKEERNGNGTYKKRKDGNIARAAWKTINDQRVEIEMKIECAIRNCKNVPSCVLLH